MRIRFAAVYGALALCLVPCLTGQQRKPVTLDDLMKLASIVDVPAKNRRPDSHDPLIYDPDSEVGWNRAKQAEDYAKVLEVWRSEDLRRNHGD